MNRIARNSMVFGLSVSLCAAFARAQTPPSNAQTPPTSAVPTSLKWYAEIAKARGQTSASITPFGEPEPDRPLKEQILQSLIVDGEVVSSTVDDSDGFQIFTWYTVRIFSRGPEPSWKGVIHGGEVPESVPRPKDGQMLVRLYCGSVVVDGVTIIQSSEPQLTAGHRYLFFLEPLRDGAFVLAFQTSPVELDGNGIINHASHSKFAHRFDRFQTLQDLLGYAK